jgi:hypothetical protein
MYPKSIFWLIFTALICSEIASFGAQCSASLNPTSTTYSSAGGNGSTTVTVNSGCAWSASSASSWIHSTNSGSGSGVANYTVDANPGTIARSGTLLITANNTATLTINQSGVPLTLAAALNNTNLVWETDATYPWHGTNNISYDGIDSAVSGNKGVQDSVSWLRTTVIGPGQISFWWKVDSLDPDNLQFFINGVSQDQISGQIDWNYRGYSIPDGTNVLEWQYIKDPSDNSGSDQGWVDQVRYVTGTPTPLQAGLNTCGINWTSGGNTNSTYWSIQTNVTHDGAMAAQSGQITTLQQSTLQTTVGGVTNVSFWWRLSSEHDPAGSTIFDNLGFYIDGVLQTNINVEEQWQQKSYKLTSASHTLQWIYSKNDFDFYPKGMDAGFVDQVVFSPPQRALPFTLGVPESFPDGTIQVPVSGEVGCTCQMTFSTNFTNWSVLSNFVTTGASTTILDSGASNSTMRFYRTISP